VTQVRFFFIGYRQPCPSR